MDTGKPECAACSMCHQAMMGNTGSASGSRDPCAVVCPTGTCDSSDDASKPECARCSSCQQAMSLMDTSETDAETASCASACPAGTCDSPADASKPECGACMACHKAIGQSHMDHTGMGSGMDSGMGSADDGTTGNYYDGNNEHPYDDGMDDDWMYDSGEGYADYQGGCALTLPRAPPPSFEGGCAL